MPIMVNQIYEEKNENFTAKPIVVTIALEEYRDLVSECQRLNDENVRLREETERAFAEKEKIQEQWERQQKWYESRMIKEREG